MKPSNKILWYFSTFCLNAPNPHECESSIADVLLEDEPIGNTIVETTVDGVDLVCGSLNLSSFDTVMGDDSSREIKLKKALSNIGGYDYILLDTAPTASLLMVNALLGVDRFIIPVTPQYLSFEGLSSMMDIVSRVKEGFGSCASLLGILLTQVDYRNKATHELVNLIRKHYKASVFKSEVRINVRVSEAPSFGKSIFQHDDECSGAQAYRKLANEIIKKTRNGEKK